MQLDCNKSIQPACQLPVQQSGELTASNISHRVMRVIASVFSTLNESLLAGGVAVSLLGLFVVTFPLSLPLTIAVAVIVGIALSTLSLESILARLGKSPLRPIPQNKPLQLNIAPVTVPVSPPSTVPIAPPLPLWTAPAAPPSKLLLSVPHSTIQPQLLTPMDLAKKALEERRLELGEDEDDDEEDGDSFQTSQFKPSPSLVTISPIPQGKSPVVVSAPSATPKNLHQVMGVNDLMSAMAKSALARGLPLKSGHLPVPSGPVRGVTPPPDDVEDSEWN